MDRDRFRRAEELFHLALARAPEERSAFLDQQCAGDGELRADLERLLAAHDRAGQGIERLEPFVGPRRDPLEGRRLGAWRVVERLAEGGMGVVYRAERADGLFEQMVAIKVLRLGGATEESLRRFELERRLLARLQHPNIARLLDGGWSEDGLPYLVMEYVDGLPIDRWCDERRLGLEARLSLFARVCRAVHFAHQNLVVHRDIKPGNVLVDRVGSAKLLDFGIGRLLEEDGPLTLPAARALTPDYASPEQLKGLPLTTATDVYSLGVVLYELLTGRPPLARGTRSPGEWERIVTQEQPPRPSTALLSREAGTGDGATVREFASKLQTTPVRLRRRLRGDLDRIVLEALRKEPERRYDSAEQFAEDVERYLDGLPVRARPDTYAYRTQRFVQRHRIAVSAAVLVVLALCIGLFVSLRGQRVAEAATARAMEERERAVEAAAHARIEADSFRLIAGFLGDTFLQSSSVERERDRIAGSVELQADQVRRQYADQPHLRANLLDALGNVCIRIDDLESAAELLREARDVRLETFGEQSLEHALSLSSLGRLHFRRGEFAAAAESFETALDLHRRLPGEVHTDAATAANDLAAAWRQLGRGDEAQRLHEQALAERRAALGTRSLPVAESLNNLALACLDRGELERGRELAREALEVREALLGDTHSLSLQSRLNLAGAEWRLERLEEAERHLAIAEAGYRALRDADRDGLVQVLSSLAALDIRRGDFASARERTREALELARGLFGADHPKVAALLSREAAIADRTGDGAAARAAWAEVLRIQRGAYPESHPLIARTLYDFGVSLGKRGECGEAEPLLREALALHRSAQPPREVDLALAELALGDCLGALGQGEEARALLETALERASRLGEGGREVAERARRQLERLGG